MALLFPDSLVADQSRNSSRFHRTRFTSKIMVQNWLTTYFCFNGRWFTL